MCGRVTACFTFAVCAMYAQQKPEFEVASVRPAAALDQAKIAAAMDKGGKWPIGASVDARRAVYTYMDLRSLMALAWGVRPYQIEGPDWIASTRFDIIPTLPAGATKKDAPRMLQSLLEDRFGLVAHRTTAEHPVLALVVGKGGLKLKPSAGTPEPIDENTPLKPGEFKLDGIDGQIRITLNRTDNSSVMNYGAEGILRRKDNPVTRSLHLEFSMTSMSGLADMLTQIFTQLAGGIGRQIVDMTGIQGHYDAILDVSLSDMAAMAKPAGPDVPAAPAPAVPGDPAFTAPPLMEAIQKLGLKLESRTAPVEQLVVDHVEKTPTGN